MSCVLQGCQGGEATTFDPVVMINRCRHQEMCTILGILEQREEMSLRARVIERSKVSDFLIIIASYP
jgi:hypothetical protein